jgi:galactoside O-acetyltransferase
MKSFLRDILYSLSGEMGVNIRGFIFKKIFKVKKIRVERNAILTYQNISIGENFRIARNSIVSATDGKLEIGENVSIMDNAQINANRSKVILGNNILIAPNVVIQGVNHNIENININFIDSGDQIGKNYIYIEDNVWIGANSVILPGVNIGKGSVIGAGSVVTKDVEPFSVMGGVPAKLIRKRK